MNTIPDNLKSPYDMTLRDYFAAAAVSGVLPTYSAGKYGIDVIQNIARTAYGIADAMLAERAK